MRIGRAAALTDTGRRRLDNEDGYVLEPPLFAVADGMGGARAGEVASRLAVTTLEAASGTHDLASLTAVLEVANATIHAQATTDLAVEGMGTTATVVVVDELSSTLLIAHVGDSRAYLLRDGQLEQLTDDHSLVAELIRGGRLTETEALAHPARSVITRVLGTDPTVEVDTRSVDLRPGDRVLLCSDGLSAMIRDHVITELLHAADDPGDATEALVAAANRAGGEDNVTVVVFELLEGEPPVRSHGTVPAPPPVAARSDEPAADLPTSLARAAAVRRHGAGEGSRWIALALLALVAVLALLGLWWGLTQ